MAGIFNIISNYIDKIVNNNPDNKEDMNLEITIEKINLFINNSVLLNYFKSYINNNHNDEQDKCVYIHTILSVISLSVLSLLSSNNFHIFFISLLENTFSLFFLV